jgi:hypothetical protein
MGPALGGLECTETAGRGGGTGPCDPLSADRGPRRFEGEDRGQARRRRGGLLQSGSLPDIDNGFEVRRARLYTSGEIYLAIPILYKVEISLIHNQVAIEDIYLRIENVRLLRSLTVGNMRTPFSLESITSGRDVTFMEEAAPTQAFAPGIKPGIALGGPVLDERATWTSEEPRAAPVASGIMRDDEDDVRNHRVSREWADGAAHRGAPADDPVSPAPRT